GVCPREDLDVLVRELRAHRVKDNFAVEVLRGDRFQAFVLATTFVINRHRNLQIGFIQRTRHIVIIFRGGYSYSSRIVDNAVCEHAGPATARPGPILPSNPTTCKRQKPDSSAPRLGMTSRENPMQNF